MESLNEELKRIKFLVGKTFNKLEPQVLNFMERHIVRIQPIYEKGFFGSNKICGQALPIDEESTRFMVSLNIFRLKILSDDAVIGTISHEFAHCLDSYRKNFSFRARKFLFEIGFRKFAYNWTEKVIDKIAVSWGFKKEIETLRKEAVENIQFLDIGSEISPIEIIKKNKVWMKNIELTLKCQDCGKEYFGNYFYDAINGSFINILKEDVPIGQARNKRPITEDDIIKYVICPSCKQRKLLITNKNDLSEVTL